MLPFFGDTSMIIVWQCKSPAGLLYFIRLFLFDFSGIDVTDFCCKKLSLFAFQSLRFTACAEFVPRNAPKGLLLVCSRVNKQKEFSPIFGLRPSDSTPLFALDKPLFSFAEGLAFKKERWRFFFKVIALFEWEQLPPLSKSVSTLGANTHFLA